MHPATVTLVVGTRPEAIKLAPLYHALRAHARLKPQWLSTGQHTTLLAQAQMTFDIDDSTDLQLMRENQTPLDVVQAVCTALQARWQETRPDMVVVQGDTATAFAAALTAFFLRIPVAHVEAGLRSFRMDEPFPEEAHRRMIAPLANLHFAPTRWAADNLLRENIAPETIHTVGNTVVDALHYIAARDGTTEEDDPYHNQRIVLVTAHRRENHGARLQQICKALLDIRDAVKDAVIVFPAHLNPQVQRVVFQHLAFQERVYVLPPLDYFTFVSIMRRSALILTDSGGLQEEAPSFRIPVLVLREQTERPEAVEAGMAKLVGSDRAAIAQNAIDLLSNPAHYEAMRQGASPFGDGHSSARIVATMDAYLQQQEKAA